MPHILNHRSARRSSSDTTPSNGRAIAPPGYGIEAFDRRVSESSPGVEVIQKMPSPKNTTNDDPLEDLTLLPPGAPDNVIEGINNAYGTLPMAPPDENSYILPSAPQNYEEPED